MKINQRICRSLDVFARQKRGMTGCGGRSMVEMLGVLAIIGVLSAGAMAGYSKAMFRHRVNQTIDIFQGVLQRFSELEQKDWGGICIGDEGRNDSAEDMISYGLFPDCQKTPEKWYNPAMGCRLPIGVLGLGFCSSPIVGGWFFVELTDSKSCVAFLSAGWENAGPSDWWNYSDSSAETEENGIRVCPLENCSGGAWIYAPNQGKTTYNMADITNACQICDEEDGCVIIFTVRYNW